MPNLLVGKIPEAIRKSKAKKIFICNLMTKVEHTKNYTVADYTRDLEKYLGGPVDIVVYNNKMPDKKLLKKYAREHDSVTPWNVLPVHHELIGANLISQRAYNANKIGTPATEASLVRHDPAKLAKILVNVLAKNKRR